MGVTPNFGISYPDGGQSITPIQTHFANQAGSVDAALLALLAKVPGRPVASDTERNALYPNPTQGDAVWRTDLNTMQRYYGLWNPVTNPTGASAAGWYREFGTITAIGRTTPLNVNRDVQTLDYNTLIEAPALNDFSYSQGVFTCQRAGKYLIQANLVMEAAGAVVGFEEQLLKNGIMIARTADQTSTVADTSCHLTITHGFGVGDNFSVRLYANIDAPGVGAKESLAETYVQIVRFGS